MTDDTQQYRNATEDELDAVTTGGLTVHEWILIGQAMMNYVTDPIDFDLTEMVQSGDATDYDAAKLYCERWVEIRNAQAEDIMNVVAVVILTHLPKDTQEYQTTHRAYHDDKPWFERAAGVEYEVADPLTILAAQAAARLN